MKNNKEKNVIILNQIDEKDILEEAKELFFNNNDKKAKG